MILATTTVEDLDRFVEIYSTGRCREAQAARLEGLDGLPRSERGRPGLGHLRLGPRRLEELRLRSRAAPIIQRAGHKTPPVVTELVGRFDA